MGGVARLGVLLAVGSVLAWTGSAAEPFKLSAARAKRSVAITFDDLPAANSSFRRDLLNDPKVFIRQNEKVLRELRRMKVPVAGFVSSSFKPSSWDMQDVHALLEVWDKAGAALGNHTTSHRDYHEMTPAAYFADILSGQQFLESALGKPPVGQKYFRAPYLHRGASQSTREQLEQYLNEHSYRIAPVTIDLQDWVFAEIYIWADANNDQVGKEAVVKGYLEYLEASIKHYALLSAVVTGRQTPHVALLHANALNYDHIKEVIERFRRQDFEFISLEAALLDPVYQQMPSASGTWIRGWQQQQGLPWVAAPAPNRYLASLSTDYQKRPLEQGRAALQ
ncbi:MAG: polysaccharide deacetylase family protein [Acidobacteria bacterium]|nr:polysaccharide deacetylase family protein [Acidobacteriota bacterium]MDA1234892.1 polysaccharide deacetylase family protein [Acidobacteriota bacterium]